MVVAAGKFRAPLSKSSSSRLVQILLPLVTGFTSPAIQVCTDTVCPTLISVVASPKSPKQISWGRPAPALKGRSGHQLFSLFLFHFSFSFFFDGLSDYTVRYIGSIFFSILYLFFFTHFFAFIALHVLAGHFSSPLAPKIVVVFQFPCRTSSLPLLSACLSSRITPCVRILCSSF